jgi:hypothetical protein
LPFLFSGFISLPCMNAFSAAVISSSSTIYSLSSSS